MSSTRRDSTLSGPLLRVVRSILRKLAVHENVHYGRNFRVGRGVVISSPHGLVLGDNVSVGPGSIVQVNGRIGDFVLIGMGVQIVGRDDHAVDEVGVPIRESTWVAHRPATVRDSIVIERDVWIGGASVVMSGVVIGQGSIVGAGSVVTHDVEPFTIVAGNPARPIRRRFGSEAREIQHASMLDARSESGGVGVV